MTTPELPPLPLLPFAVFDEFGKGADDRVQDYGRECARTAIAPLEAEVAAMRKDAARFQWLEAHGDHGINFMTGVFRTEFQAQAFRTAGGTMLRAAIDSAMNTKGESA